MPHQPENPLDFQEEDKIFKKALLETYKTAVLRKYLGDQVFEKLYEIASKDDPLLRQEAQTFSVRLDTFTSLEDLLDYVKNNHGISFNDSEKRDLEKSALEITRDVLNDDYNLD